MKESNFIDTVSLWIFDPLVGKIIFAVISCIAIILFAKIMGKLFSKQVNALSSRYRVRKVASFLGYFVAGLVLIAIFSDRLSNLTVAFGVAGAGIAFALQEVFASLAGWIAISFGNFFKIGDRVQLGGIIGDVIDVGMLRTTLMECGEWINGDLYNGRIVRVANSFVFKEPVFNYSGDFPFLWDEIVIPIRHGSDIEYTQRLFEEIANRCVGEFTLGVETKWKALVQKYPIENAQLVPLVTKTFNHNWIDFTIRYVVDFKKRRITKDKISTQILLEAMKDDNKVRIACSTLEISGNISGISE